MLVSMTGFGEAHSQGGPLEIAAEVRTINSRHLKVSLRCPEVYNSLEPLIESLVRGQFRRGTVQVNLRVLRATAADDYCINRGVLESYYKQIEAIVAAHRSDDVPMHALLTLPGVIEEHKTRVEDPQADWPQIEPIVRKACEAASQMRLAEGRALADDLMSQCESIDRCLQSIATRAPKLGDDYRQRLTARIDRALAGMDISLQPTDVIREVAIFCDRSDISEEAVRLRSHLEQFESTVKKAEGGGRKLEFITQEMGREVNTIGSKANDTEISANVVDMKTALERIREQIQNVE
ncbi:Conserved hypothetical protein CHP00255 [Pirellulimonas nuda]|uniref:YicC-like family, N-terminal region n=1 Tax=Pirellulimonas nuda TaxID=2528009 RepID=A0A518DGS0_9BACT|nr:YicC/YloC family endoribonuclease [Pirellulimonas nuda]QDU90668.1 Conserved hypothetical protein CHP00255 [Pirellulimonas nuda]